MKACVLSSRPGLDCPYDNAESTLLRSSLTDNKEADIHALTEPLAALLMQQAANAGVARPMEKI